MKNNKKIPFDWDDCKTDEDRRRWIEREEGETEMQAKADQDAGCYDDPSYGGFYEDLKEFRNE